MSIDLGRLLGSAMRVLENEPMSRHTTMKVGGPADFFAIAESPQQVRLALAAAHEASAPLLAIGNGSNLIVRDGGVRGVVLQIAMNAMKFEGNEAAAEAGCSLSDFVLAAQAAGLMGLEFAQGIPGSVGGAVAMNAGAYGGVVSTLLLRVDGVSLSGEYFSIGPQEAGFGYRRSCFQRDGSIVVKAYWRLPDDDGGALSRIQDYAARRREKQPLHQPSAGSVFRRPEGHFAGKLIEDAGLKGMRVGGAMVSEKHAGFIVNVGGASAADITALIALVQKRVMETSGILLQTEVKLVGEDSEA